MSSNQEVTMQGIVEKAEWIAPHKKECGILYQVWVPRPDHKDENLVGHVVTLTKPAKGSL